MSDEMRELMNPVGQGVRAYFAPVMREGGTPTMFDPAACAGFDLDVPPSPWRDMGWIENLKRTSATSIAGVAAGAKGITTAQYKTTVEASVEFDFREWGKLQMALAACGQHMNVLESNVAGAESGSGGAPVSSYPTLAGTTDTELVMGAAASNYAAGDLVAVDVDYQQQTGYVGTGISAAYVKFAADVLQHPDYVRRVTFNVGRVVEVTSDALLLDRALPGGVPEGGACVQKVVAFVDREGGSFFHEWSALFVIPEVSGGRLCFYYPRLQSAAAAAEVKVEMEKPFTGTALHASFRALAVIDRNDSEQVLCFRTYYPAKGAAAW